MLVANRISFPSPINMHDPTIPSSSIIFYPSAFYFFPIVIRLQNFQDHEPYPYVIDLSNSQFDSPCKKQKSTKERGAKTSYDSIGKFQTEWVAKMPWKKGIVSQDGSINLMKHKVYFLIKRKEKPMGCKWDTLTKHQGHPIAQWDMPNLGVKKRQKYTAKNCAHMKNYKLYMQRGSKSILAQMNRLAGEGNQNIVQMKLLCFIFCLMVIQCWNMSPCMSSSRV